VLARAYQLFGLGDNKVFDVAACGVVATAVMQGKDERQGKKPTSLKMATKALGISKSCSTIDGSDHGNCSLHALIDLMFIIYRLFLSKRNRKKPQMGRQKAVCSLQTVKIVLNCATNIKMTE